MNNIKTKIEFYLNDSITLQGKIIDLILIGLNLLVCVLFVVDSYLENGLPIFFKIIEFAIVIVFGIEYFLRVWIAKSKIKYIFSFYAMIDIISIIPSVIILYDLRFLRGFKVLRILRFIRFLETESFFFGKITPLQLQAAKTIFTVFTIIFVSAGFIHYAEANCINANIKTFGDSFYFIVITLSTVGFGDFIPVSSMAKVVTTIMILGGAILIPWQAGKLIHILIKNDTIKKNVVCSKCGLTRHDIDASHCKACGSIIYQEYDGDL